MTYEDANGGGVRAGLALVQVSLETERMRRVFSEALGTYKKQLNFEEFQKIVPCKNKFFVKRIFHIFDNNGDGTISLNEFIDTITHFSHRDDDTKLEFLFNVYDINGDGHLEEEHFVVIIRACIKESGMEFEEEELISLAKALYSDGVKEGNKNMSFEDFKQQLQRQKGLLENMTNMIHNWCVPPKPPMEKSWTQKMKEKLPKKYFTSNYWKTHTFLKFFLLFIIIVNLSLIIPRKYYFRNFAMLNGFTPNPLSMISRASGRALQANIWLLLFFVLRHTLTLIQKVGLGTALPLDHSIFLHKLVGWLVFGYSVLHTICHLLDFAINIQPNPVKFVQLNWRYWSESYGEGKILDFYQTPPGCLLVKGTDPLANFCLPDSLTLPQGLDLDTVYNRGQAMICQACPPSNTTSATPWTYTDWIFTNRPGLFGLFNYGLANPTGIGLIIVIFLMVILSLPFIRRGGYFEVFFQSHRIGYVLFIVLLFLHAPDFWKWFFAFVGPIWIIEKIYRWIMSTFGHGKTVIKEGVILPSNVTKLIIERPSGFNFNPGDWIWIRIPAVSRTEWHPFTISSAPEKQGQLTLHIRGVGHWTNRLHRLFEEEHEKQTNGHDNQAFDIVINRSISTDGTVTNMGKRVHLDKSLNHVYIDGPFGSPSSNVYRAEHAVLIGTNIGVTPFASILQSIMHRYWSIKKCCPNCEYKWSDNIESSMFKLRKVDFFWINRSQMSFKWFVNLLSKLEVEQAEAGSELSRFLEMHMYVTSALQKTDMKAVALQMALDLLHQKEKRDLVTGLKSRTQAGRPNWNKVFTKIREEMKGKVTIFYCGNPALANVLRQKCDDFGFTFRKETF